MRLSELPENGFLRIKDILGDRAKGIPALIPVSTATWWREVKSGKYPAPVRLSARTSAWRVSDIRALVERLERGEVYPSDDCEA